MNSFMPYGHMLQEYYVAKVREISRLRKKRLDDITSSGQAETYVREVREKTKAVFGNFPEKTPLNARTTGKLGKKGFIIEKVVFESRPGFPVTGLLYLPEKSDRKIPGVLGVCGHSGNGKAETAYQLFCQGLVLKGFAVFIYDPISQGERLQFLDASHAEAISGLCTYEHNMIGKQLRLCGEFFGSWRAWDGIRALDYLASRPEVDPARIGVTGNSGGGTLTSYVNALDDRPMMAAPGCYITTYLNNLENEIPCDSEQIPPGILAAGCEMADLLIARAPRPILILGQQNDAFDIRGTRDAYADVKHIYSLLGAEENACLFVGPTDHGYFIENREQMYAFFGKHAGIDCDAKEPPMAVPLAETEILCAPQGQVKNIPGSKLAHDFIMEKSARLASGRPALDADTLRRKLLQGLNIEYPVASPYLRVVRPRVIRGADKPENTSVISSFAVETEPGIVAVLKFSASRAFFQLPQGNLAWLYISHQSAEAELAEAINELRRPDANIFGLDVRGVGETTPMTCGNADFFAPYGYDYFYAAYGIMLGRPYLGGKVHDVLSVIRLLKDNGYGKIGLVGRGLGSIVAAFAALLADDVVEVRLVNAPLSYEFMIRHPVTNWPLSHMLPGILEYTDLPDIYQVLKDNSFKIINPWDEMMKPGSFAKS